MSETSKKNQTKRNPSQFQDKAKGQDVLLNLPAGMKYKLPGKQQRVVLGSIVVGLNLLLVVAVLFYFYNPAFQDFIFNIGRE
tara:strand:+ start:55 stop:300 length:246 start_codon:yes stop_codon:yes gene_type:complete